MLEDDKQNGGGSSESSSNSTPPSTPTRDSNDTQTRTENDSSFIIKE
ncbi:hypothetical protein SAMN05444377_1253 [Flavobacterium fontis]|uniref:Uncharacterized protein n=1 Tax=Flavobacterium fontis TaxID=1124188 RepID=A0A1M5F0F2_9FLAO|nr:hypothetical protein SAMN05444377_1253 [Flavobacterium fontis]